MFYLFNNGKIYGLNTANLPMCASPTDDASNGYSSYSEAEYDLNEAVRTVQNNSLGFPESQIDDSLRLLNRLEILPDTDERIMNIMSHKGC